AHRAGDAIALQLDGAAPGNAWQVTARSSIGVEAPHAAQLEADLSSDDPGQLVPEERRDLLRGTTIHARLTAQADRLGSDATILASAALDGTIAHGISVERGDVSVRFSPELLDLPLVAFRAGRTDLAGSAWLALDGTNQGALGASIAGTVDLALAPGVAGL